jgi:hypothetical protein
MLTARPLALLACVVTTAALLAACGGTEYETSDMVSAFNKNFAEQQVVLTCPETVPADAKFDCTFKSTADANWKPQTMTFSIEKDELQGDSEEAVGAAILKAVAPKTWQDMGLAIALEDMNKIIKKNGYDSVMGLTCPTATDTTTKLTCTMSMSGTDKTADLEMVFESVDETADGAGYAFVPVSAQVYGETVNSLLPAS